MKCFCFLTLIGVSFALHSQENAPFTRDKEFFVKGNTVIAGNSILGKYTSKSFDRRDKVNDEIKMRYIDIDSDPTTWSSSSAYFKIPEIAKIKYAGLYWSATYYGEKSGERLNEDVIYYKKLEERSHNPQLIKFKTPNGNYQEVLGSLIYDGENAKNRTINTKAPYAYFADVTDLLDGYYEGDITVANIPATQGKINGGSSAGWLLYIVYEDHTQPLQYISTFYGFESIKKETVEIDFGNFKTSDKGELSTFITIGALEGDTNLLRDQVRLFNPESKLYLSMGNRIRPANNFFNSSITIDESFFVDRNPKGENTLGFDIAKVKVDKEQNEIIANSSEGIKMQFNTRGDHYFVFFTAFQTTVNEDFYSIKENQNSKLNTVISELDVKDEIDSKPIEVADGIESKILDETLIQIIDKPSVEIPSLRSGFYIISNVFANPENAAKWAKVIEVKGMTSNTHYRPDNQYYYVSLGNNSDPVIMYNLLKKLRDDPDFKNAWILKVNL